MEKDKSYPRSTALTKIAAEDDSISDFRKTTRSFDVVARGGFTVNDTEELCGAMIFDLLAGKVKVDEAAGIYKFLDAALCHEEHLIQREEMALRSEMLRRRSHHLKAGRDLLNLQRT